MQEFMSQLIYSPHRVVIVVGHSHLFREILREYQAPGFSRGPKAALAAEVGRHVLCNCGVAKVELDTTETPATPIVDIELVLGTACVHKKALCAAPSMTCCAAPSGNMAEEGTTELMVQH